MNLLPMLLPVIKIKLTRGMTALINECDAHHILKNKWNAHRNRNSNEFYAHRGTKVPGTRKNITVSMARQIMGFPNGMVDHKNHNTLDNRRSNLRTVTNRQNKFNSPLRRNAKTSRFKGVHYDKKNHKWMARITLNGTMQNLGRYSDETHAAMAYNKAAIKAFGEFAFTNSVLPCGP